MTSLVQSVRLSQREDKGLPGGPVQSLSQETSLQAVVRVSVHLPVSKEMLRFEL